MNAYSGTKLATARIRLRSLSADGVQWVLQEHLPGHVGLCVGSDTHASGGTLLPSPPLIDISLLSPSVHFSLSVHYFCPALIFPFFLSSFLLPVK